VMLVAAAKKTNIRIRRNRAFGEPDHVPEEIRGSLHVGGDHREISQATIAKVQHEALLLDTRSAGN
jgi:hypothetical protein